MLLLSVFLSYFIGILCIFILKNVSLQKKIALVSAGFALLFSAELFRNYKGTYQGGFYKLTELISPNFLLDYSFGLDGLSVSFLFLSSLLIFICVLFIWNESNFKNYSISLLFIGFFLSLVFTVQDLLFFYIAFEAILIPMFLIIGVWGSRARKIRAAYLLFFYTLTGSFIALLGILYIYNKVGTLNFEYLISYPFTLIEQKMLWLAFFIAFASKVPMFPVHIWLPEAHVEAPTVGSVLLAGILLKLGVYGFLRYNLTLFFEASLFFAPFVYMLSILGVIYASLAALRQTDMKRIIAYSSIAHMNLVVLGIFSFNTIGIEGSIIQSLSHGFVSGGMFLIIGILYSRYHSRFIHYYGGLVHFMPIFAGLFLIFTMANIALPGTSSFVGEFLLLLGIYQKNSTAAVFSALGVILSGAYSLWLYNRIIFGNVKANYTNFYEDINFREFIIMFVLLILVFVLGLYPELFIVKIKDCSNFITLSI